MSDGVVYSVAGNVLANGGYYVVRKADDDLFSHCCGLTFAYVLAPRQVGKSSMITLAASRLGDQGMRTVIIDLNQIGVCVTADEWYLGQLVIIQDQLALRTDVIDWWNEHNYVGFAQRLVSFFRKVLLSEIAEPVVIFVDEIEVTRSLDFSDEFFAAIRSVYNARAAEKEFKRLSFVLSGMATPNELIRDPTRTPFNIGRRVEVTDFTLEEALPLADGLGLPPDESRQALEWILRWTGGHPYLTQRLCRAVAEGSRGSWAESDIDEMVAATFLGEMSEKDTNLLVVRDMLVKGGLDPAEVLNTYRAIYRSSPAVRDDNTSPVKLHLKLSGVVNSRRRSLHVRNQIYRKVFTEEWVDGCLVSPI